MKVLCFGDRSWANQTKIREKLEQLPRDTVIIHGDNGYGYLGDALWGKPDELAKKGADKLCGKIARELGMEVIVYTPNWELHHKAAGPIRNKRMLQEGPKRAICFHSNLSNSRGSLSMYQQCLKAGIPVEVVK